MEDVEGYVTKLKVIELKDELKKRSLSTAGVKSVLAQRLQEAMTKEKADEEEEAPMEEQTETACPEPEVGEDEPAESKMEEEPAETDEPVEQEEDKEDEVEESEETEEEPSEPAPSQPEPVQTSEPSTDTPETTTPSTHTEPTPTEAVTAQPTGKSVAQPTEGTEQAATTSMDTPTQEANTEPAATEAPCDDKPAAADAPCDDKPAVQTEKSEDVAPNVTNSQSQSGPEAEEKMEKMETTTSETDAKQPEATSLGSKRPLEKEEAPKAPKLEPTKVDPSNAPDPEEPESFDDSQVLMENRFNPPEDESVVTLDKYTSDLYFNIGEDGLGGCGLTEQGFARLWASTRGSIGVKGGRYYYQVKVEENVSVQLPESEEHPHAIRVGWTVDETRKGLGEGRGSFGYGSTAKKSSNNKFEEYGECFGPGDVIGCYIDFESCPATVFFSKNSTNLGSAFSMDESQSIKTYYPCITTKNVSFSVNFGGSPAWCEVEGVEGYKFLQEASEEHRVRAPKGPSSASDCEVIMMIGLPASGKTTWAEKHCEKHPSKRYTILGTNLIMERMKVSGLSRKENYRARFEALIKEATEILNKLFLLASKNYRNYIIDQTNVYSGAQARKMKYFEGFAHKAEVVVPPHHELRRRTALRNEEMGGPLPDSAINAMKANFHIPKAGTVFEEVNYSDIYGVAAEKIVRQYREDALGLPSYPQSKRGRYDNYRGGGGGGSRYGGHRHGGGGGGGGHSGYHPSHSYGSYHQRDHYGYDGGSYGYHNPRPRYSPYGNPQQPQMYGNSPRGGGGGGGGGGGYGSPQYRSQYNNNQGHYRGNYGGPPPPRRGGGYYGRY